VRFDGVNLCQLCKNSSAHAGLQGALTMSLKKYLILSTKCWGNDSHSHQTARPVILKQGSINPLGSAKHCVEVCGNLQIWSLPNYIIYTTTHISSFTLHWPNCMAKHDLTWTKVQTQLQGSCFLKFLHWKTHYCRCLTLKTLTQSWPFLACNQFLLSAGL